MRKHYLLQDDDGVLTVFAMQWEEAEKPRGHGHWHQFGTVPIENQPPALAVGVKVLGIANAEQRELDDTPYATMNSSNNSVGVAIDFVELPPQPVTGLAYLKSLAEMLPYVAVEYPMPFVPMNDGLHWRNGSIWRWDGSIGSFNAIPWTDVGWVQKASPETIQPWHPA